jgi:hypothetical protein
MKVGESVRRPDGVAKVRGDFVYSSDLHAEGMLWGATVRSPHPYARIKSIDTSEAVAAVGVMAVLTHRDIPGRNAYGLEIPDQPVLAADVVRYWGEAVALVAADHPEQARRAAEKVRVDYEVLAPITEAEAALDAAAPRLHPGGNVTRDVKIRHGDPDARAEIVVTGEYEIGMQDQAPLGLSPASPFPDSEAASTSTPRRSGCTSTRSSWPRCLACRRRRCASRWRASAARSARARTCRCRRTRASSRCAPAGRSRSRTRGRSRSSAMSTATPGGCTTSTGRIAMGASST